MKVFSEWQLSLLCSAGCSSPHTSRDKLFSVVEVSNKFLSLIKYYWLKKENIIRCYVSTLCLLQYFLLQNDFLCVCAKFFNSNSAQFGLVTSKSLPFQTLYVFRGTTHKLEYNSSSQMPTFNFQLENSERTHAHTHESIFLPPTPNRFWFSFLKLTS